MRPLVCAIALAGCGRLQFAELLDGGDRDPDAAPGTGPWSNVTELVELNIGAKNDDPTLTGDQLEIYFNSERDGTGDIFVSTRAAVGDPWAPPQKVVELSLDTVIENTPEVSADGLEIYFSRENTATDVYVSTRGTRADAWSAPVLVPQLNTTGINVGTYVLPDRLTIYMAGGNTVTMLELELATRATTSSTWSTPAAIPELSSAGFDSDPYVTSDQLEIYWSSERLTSAFDLWHAERATTGMPFANLALVSELVTSIDEDDPWMSSDRHTLYFTRGTLGTDVKIFTATR